MKAGCYLTLALLTALILGAHAWYSRILDPPEVWIASIASGVAYWLCIGAFWNAWHLGEFVRALRNAHEGLTPRDGVLAAVEGVIEPYDQPLLSPISGEPCVVYEYEISRVIRETRNSQTTKRNVVDFCGIGMAPCYIRHHDEVYTLLGFPDLDDINPARNRGDERTRAQKWVREADWEDFSGFKVLSGIRELWGALTKPGETVQRNFRMVSAADCAWLRSPELLEDDADRQAAARSAHNRDRAGGRLPDDAAYSPTITEKRINVGRPLVAMGIYRADAEALTTQPGTTFRRLCLLSGPLVDELQDVRARRRAYLIGGMIGSVLVTTVAWGMLTLYSRSEKTVARWGADLKAAIETVDIPKLERQRLRGLNLNTPLTSSGERGLHLAEDPRAATWLIENGADLNLVDEDGRTPLMGAVRANHPEVAAVLIAAGADLNYRRPSDRATALVLADILKRTSIADQLRAAAAVDELVTAATGETITAEHPAAVAARNYFQALQNQDGALFTSATEPIPAFDVESSEWKTWATGRPREPRLTAGFVRGSDATLDFHEAAPLGIPGLWRIQLVQTPERGWRVLRDRELHGF